MVKWGRGSVGLSCEVGGLKKRVGVNGFEPYGAAEADVIRNRSAVLVRACVHTHTHI